MKRGVKPTEIALQVRALEPEQSVVARSRRELWRACRTAYRYGMRVTYCALANGAGWRIWRQT